MKKYDDPVKSNPSKNVFQTCDEVNQNYRLYPAIIAERMWKHSHLASVEEPVININATKLREIGINEVVGLCIKLLLKRTFKTEFPVFEEAFARDLRKAIWEVLTLHAGHLHMGKKGS